MTEFTRSLFCRLGSTFPAVSVRAKILGMGLVLLFGAGVTFQVCSSLVYILQAQLENESITSARDLAACAIAPILLNDLVES